ncbi:helix-turn-helix domain-containing protein [Niallia taxi]|uniref:XRE family transcriptional regulator n=1 Tax=Niallia taxi TaxID=2499688 RepID=A0A3S2TZX4_9BACI|nr:helix-turn-helix transcriptional regulator [Niallia taxi]MCM3216217.1 helix-turn-helix transcriptional regulator [Niallia taxi]MCT2342526.1 helix-turn-helix transcriptional regulator [Niallia taxi]MDK8643055.1 helix-turn-helix transcriptional regulator [Niallia taxi]MED3965599.1 helix-turn-helix transcriptional regulator [Niallia taxi]MED4037120.1 helix-turn-helix transcriptional regulator [Niallia taxi]
MSFPERLKALRKSANISQQILGDAMNVTKVSISGYENGNRKPDTETLQNLADYFNVSTDYLLGRSAVMETASQYGSDMHLAIPAEDYSILVALQRYPDLHHALKENPEKVAGQLFRFWSFLQEESKL